MALIFENTPIITICGINGEIIYEGYYCSNLGDILCTHFSSQDISIDNLSFIKLEESHDVYTIYDLACREDLCCDFIVVVKSNAYSSLDKSKEKMYFRLLDHYQKRYDNKLVEKIMDYYLPQLNNIYKDMYIVNTTNNLNYINNIYN